MKRKSNEASLGEIIREMIEQNRWQKGLNEVNVKQAWGEIMGNGVLAYTNGILFKNGVLYVQLTSSVLREELSYGRTKIVQMLNEHLGSDIVKDVQLR